MVAAYLVTVPFSDRMAQISPAIATWWDLVALVVGASLLGDPVFLIAWFPLVIIANLFYLGSIAAIRNSLAMVVVTAAYFFVMTATSDWLFDAETVRTYLAATLLMWACAAVVYAFAVGGAVTRRESVITDAFDQRDAAEARARAEASRLRAVLEEAPIGLLVQGADGLFIYVNAGPVIEVEIRSGAVLVCDDGPPVPLDERDRMFDAYERVHNQPGTPDSVGLGLTVCRRLSRLMGGDVVYDHDGSWSIFTVRLPES